MILNNVGEIQLENYDEGELLESNKDQMYVRL